MKSHKKFWHELMMRKSFFQNFFAIYAFTLGIVFVAVVLFGKVPETNQRLADVILGSLLGVVTTVVTYYFGSSKGSKDKDEAIQELTVTVKKGNGQISTITTPVNDKLLTEEEKALPE